MSGDFTIKSSLALRIEQLNNTKTVCMFPWVHLHTTPSGVAAPCCISHSASTPEGVGNSQTQTLQELINSPQMRQLRLDMVNGVRNIECNKCHTMEDSGIESPRLSTNNGLAHYYTDAIADMLPDGSLPNFKMRYFDIRFSNICNFKCRTCGPEFSSQWEQELKHTIIPIESNKNPIFLQEVIDQLDNVEVAYFAGGEPLITEEHYILLEEMIRKNRTDIRLQYNTNMSTLKFKDKDLIGLWKHFINPISIDASIDHYGERAEYIRKGTNWELVKNNFMLVKKLPNVSVRINTVLSLFNCLTMHKFYEYLLNNKMYSVRDDQYSIHNMLTPFVLSVMVLPIKFKELTIQSLEKTMRLLRMHGFDENNLFQLQQTANWITNSTESSDWNLHKLEVKDKILQLDAIRGENFIATFPELANLFDE